MGYADRGHDFTGDVDSHLTDLDATKAIRVRSHGSAGSSRHNGHFTVVRSPHRRCRARRLRDVEQIRVDHLMRGRSSGRQHTHGSFFLTSRGKSTRASAVPREHGTGGSCFRPGRNGHRPPSHRSSDTVIRFQEEAFVTNDPCKEQQGEGNRPESDGPDQPQPPALPPKEPGEPRSPEKSHDIHGAPETPV